MENDYIKVYTGSMVLVQQITARLKEKGISPVIKDEMESGRLAGFAASIPFQQEVYVRPDELDDAVVEVESALAEMNS